jgi:hypothetical protein
MKTKSYIITSLLLLVLFVACQKSTLPDRTLVATGARICFINFSPDSPEINLYFNDNRVTTQQSTVVGRLRGIPFRSSYPGSITQTPVATTIPSPYIGAEYFVATEGATVITAKDTAFVTGLKTYFTTNFTFLKDKYYSIFAMDPKITMAPVIIEDNIVAFETVKKTKLRCVNAISGVVGNKIDVWMIPQPLITAWAFAPYKLASGLDYKTATAFTDTISAVSYKWMVTKAGAVPLTNTAPTLIGTPYNLTFTATDIIINKASANTTFAERTTYSFLFYGNATLTGVSAPYGSTFRNRLK